MARLPVKNYYVKPFQPYLFGTRCANLGNYMPISTSITQLFRDEKQIVYFQVILKINSTKILDL